MRAASRRANSGVSLFEAVLALALLAMMIPGLWTLVARHRSAASVVANRAEVLEGVRTLSWLLDRELGLGTEGRDWFAGSDSVVLRAFRGFAVVDSMAPDSVHAVVCYSGVRRPDPAKDSILRVGPNGSWTAVGLLARRETASHCSEGRTWGTEETWTLSGPPGAPGFARVFERGSYHFSRGAFRYRRGEGGRQPLTAEFLTDGRFQSLPQGRSGLGWEVVTNPPTPLPVRGDAPGRSGTWRGAGG